MQKQESENEVRLGEIRGQIEAEAMKKQLLAARRENILAEGLVGGEAEALRVRGFLDGLGEQLGSAEKLAILQMLHKGEALEKLSRGNAHLYFTPSDVDLSIEARQGFGANGKG